MENIIDRGIFRHLRKQHNAVSGGKKNKFTRPTDLTDLSIEMTSSNIREIIFRAIKLEFNHIVKKFKELKIFQREEPVLFSKRIHMDFVKTDHIIIVEIHDDIVTPQLIERVPFNVPLEMFVRVNIAKYGDDDDDDEPKEIILNSIKYSVGQLVGEGGFGKCFELTSSKNDKLACKAIRKESGMANIVQNEVNIHGILQQSQHQHVVQFVTSFEDEKHVFILMNLCPTNLSSVMEVQFFFEFEQCRSLIRQVLSGADYLHQHNIIHRDIKLSNILLDQNHHVRICDFGISVKTNASDEDLRAFCGTVAYTAPEIIYRRGAKTQSDIWSIAVMMFYMYKAKHPFSLSSNHTENPENIQENTENMYNRIRKADYKTYFYDEPLFVEFIAQVFKRDPNLRPSALGCLALPIFANDHICK